MTPYYADDLVTIYHGDCRAWMPDADAVVTDPPYGTGYYATDTDALTPAMLKAWTGSYGFVAVFGWPERLVSLCGCADVQPDEWITWWPTNGRVRGFNQTGLWRESEAIAVFGSAEWRRLTQPRAMSARSMSTSRTLYKGRVGAAWDSDARMGDVWRDDSPNLFPNQPVRHHPNEKPVALLARLLTVVPDALVLDPFLGSGSTLVAAKGLGRKAIGIEIEERYCEVAATRCSQEVLGLVG